MNVSENCWKIPCKYKCRYGFPGSNLVDSCGIHAKGTSRIVLLNKNFKPIILSDNNEDIIVIDVENVDTVDLNDNNVSSLWGINQVNRKKTGCQEEGCLVEHPSYGYPGTKVLYCSKHGKPKGMIDVKHPKCLCGRKRPSFGLLGGNLECCDQCRSPGMINLNNRKCSCGSGKKPSFGLPGGEIQSCGDCKAKGMSNLTNKKCPCGSRKQMSFGFPEGKRQCCGDCKKPEMINLVHKKCSCGSGKELTFGTYSPSSDSSSNGNIKGHMRGELQCCSDCKKQDMINMKYKKCSCGSNKYPIYGHKGQKVKCCRNCKESGMIDLVNKKCACGSGKQPSFGFSGGRVECCKNCRDPSMIGLIHKECSCGSGKRPTFGHAGEKPRHCGECKGTTMIYLNKRKCSCGKQPSFGLSGGRLESCKNCKTSDMVSSKHKRCPCGSGKRPTFGHTGTKPLHCGDCKSSGMINLNNRRCQHLNCNVQANHGLPGNHKTSCNHHKITGMIKNPRRRCFQTNCNQIALYGESTHQYCLDHSNSDMNNFIERDCISCGLPEILNSEMKCKNCDEVHFMKRRLMKQNKVRDLLLARGYQFKSCDRIIEGSCDRERPDFVYYSENEKHVIIVEVDENQHARYDGGVIFRGVPTDCETVRMINIVHSFGGLKVIFIRYNPDQFKVNGIKQEVSDLKRHDTLISYLKYYLEMDIPDETDNWLQVKYLFYDDYDPVNTELIKIPIEYDNLSDQDFNEYNELLGYEQDNDFEDEYEGDSFEEKCEDLENIEDCSYEYVRSP